MIVSKVQKKLRRELKLFNIQFQDFTKTSPILVYQSGKVGSSTVVDSLQALKIKHPIYHVHYLAPDSLTDQNLGKPKFSKALRSKIDSYENITTINWKIISLTRDPIAAAISSLFQKIGNSQNNVFLKENGEIDKSLVFEELSSSLKNFSNSNFCNWFDRELKTVFNIDIFQYPFNFDDGYILVKHKNIDLLVIRLEDLNRSGGQALANFLNLTNPVPIISSNIGNTKRYKNTYKQVKQNISISQEICNKIYNSKYATHFYSQQEILKFTQKWSKKN
ncbi:MAG: hypothetical protein Tsb0014_00230 [Pleurocapsa sp.]